MKKTITGLMAAALLAGCGQGSDSGSGSGSAQGGQGGAPAGPAGRAVWAAGSSTVFPFASRVAENYQQKTQRPAPRVESLGTGGGIKAFCNGVGPNTSDVATASRRMKASEFKLCAQNGVTEIIEIPIGYDGVVIATDVRGADYDFQLQDIYSGLAAEVPAGAGFAANRAATWRDVRAALPANRIQVYGPPPTSGTRDSFVELGMEGGAKKIAALAALRESDEDAFKARAGRLREDGAWIDAGENDNALLQTLTKTPGALGVFGYSFLAQNRDKVKAAKIAGVTASPETVQDGSYPLARSLYIYVKKAHVGVTPGLREFVMEFVSDAAAGRGGYLQGRGLIPLPPQQLTATRQAATALTPMAAPAS
jgi:phosphate transport system substrate-binding protein